MVSSIGKHGEPFRGDVLTGYLVKRWGAKPIRQRGSHIRLELPDGRRVPSIADTSRYVASSLMRQVAEVLDMTYNELRADMGFPVQQSGKPRGDRSEPKRQIIGRGTVVRALTDLRRELDEIERHVTERDRDPSIYERAHKAVTEALREATHYRRSLDLIKRTHFDD